MELCYCLPYLKSETDFINFVCILTLFFKFYYWEWKPYVWFPLGWSCVLFLVILIFRTNPQTWRLKHPYRLQTEQFKKYTRGNLSQYIMLNRLVSTIAISCPNMWTTINFVSSCMIYKLYTAVVHYRKVRKLRNAICFVLVHTFAKGGNIPVSQHIYHHKSYFR